MARYTEAVDIGNGALFIAVHRGKLSEYIIPVCDSNNRCRGIDFSDSLARAVLVGMPVCSYFDLYLIAGIPFPNVKDEKVNEKRSYNNSGQAKGLLSGSEWYNIQAVTSLLF